MRTEPRPYPLDPLRVAEQKSSFPVTRKGSRSNAYAYCTPTHVVAKTAEDALLFRKRQEETLRDSERQLLPVGVLYLHCWNEPKGRFFIVS